MPSNDVVCAGGLRATKRATHTNYGWLDCFLVWLLSRLLPQSPVLAQKADGTDGGSFATSVDVTEVSWRQPFRRVPMLLENFPEKSFHTVPSNSDVSRENTLIDSFFACAIIASDTR
jgi:hypothetical protein